MAIQNLIHGTIKEYRGLYGRLHGLYRAIQDYTGLYVAKRGKMGLNKAKRD